MLFFIFVPHVPTWALSGSMWQYASVMQVDIFVTPGTHSTEAAVNKQLNDKERVAAALENPNLLAMVNKSLASCHQ